MEIRLWIFPRGDFAAWCKLVGTPEVADYDGYLTLTAAIQADMERQGQSVRRVHFSVADMLAGLAVMGLENSPENRAAVTAARTVD